ncbi:hypothetical protein B0H12DRAFT_1068241 [Mycena haematopus]|nr:hypothetical protein B0H12DRAFT_1068241 [Mycena haematopus]
MSSSPTQHFRDFRQRSSGLFGADLFFVNPEGFDFDSVPPYRLEVADVQWPPSRPFFTVIQEERARLSREYVVDLLDRAVPIFEGLIRALVLFVQRVINRFPEHVSEHWRVIYMDQSHDYWTENPLANTGPLLEVLASAPRSLTPADVDSAAQALNHGVPALLQLARELRSGTLSPDFAHGIFNSTRSLIQLVPRVGAIAPGFFPSLHTTRSSVAASFRGTSFSQTAPTRTGTAPFSALEFGRPTGPNRSPPGILDTMETSALFRDDTLTDDQDWTFSVRASLRALLVLPRMQVASPPCLRRLWRIARRCAYASRGEHAACHSGFSFAASFFRGVPEDREFPRRQQPSGQPCGLRARRAPQQSPKDETPCAQEAPAPSVFKALNSRQATPRRASLRPSTPFPRKSRAPSNGESEADNDVYVDVPTNDEPQPKRQKLGKKLAAPSPRGDEPQFPPTSRRGRGRSSRTSAYEPEIPLEPSTPLAC